MPEGDTIHRAARALRRALHGQIVRDAAAHPRVQIAATRMAGRQVGEVEARAKHLLLWLHDQAGGESPLALHTHQRMTGSWHLYRPGEPWRKSPSAATVWLSTDEWVAVCFSAPVCALLSEAEVARHPVLSALGPDLAAPEPDLDQAAARLRGHEHRALADVLLDQRLFAGVGNVYKSELCFLHGLHPATPLGQVAEPVRRALFADAARLLARNVASAASARITTTDGPTRLHVYGRGGQPCLRCGTAIRSARLGDPARRTNWCPRCQPLPPSA